MHYMGGDFYSWSILGLFAQGLRDKGNDGNC